MNRILIAEEHPESRKVMADLCMEAGYNVTVTTTAAAVLQGILKKTAQVILLGSSFDELAATDLIPLFKKCCRNLTIILVSNEASLPVIRKMRNEGIFYHLLRPVLPEDREELKQVINCALHQPKRCYC
ncbi:Response regulator receiver domain-containing protein [Trichlorobacter thiogenes]|jgi:DNA-binding NtrC family response regulator|uniref:Response regulator receiver domain-containing protein n=1 Tax=Trichlorobacter thiogenes TaxID=115783 RepID=A0A1T4N2V5_9BACT|nr:MULTISPECIES: response regulator [Trichlorobacter]MDD2500423.1 response regulator [Geobacter sp.]MDK9717334.1 response regulator [Trichlorobacter sp.]SJZ73700.1 Response regulator receiver domain-containing protein [Trichlorobacter thiogenes]